MAKISRKLSQRFFEIRKQEELQVWLSDVSKEVGGIIHLPLGGISNNVHTVEVASDPALALVERPINSIDAMLELEARKRNETAPTPHEAAHQWFGVPKGGIAAIPERDPLRRKLANNIRVTMHESGIGNAPSISIQDRGVGVHPSEFRATLLSLLGENKKMKRHVMGVYNAGGAASFKYARAGLLASRLEPSLLGEKKDEIGVSVVQYNPLDPNAYKTGRYEYVAAKDQSILVLDLDEMPNGFGYGTYVMLLEYEMPKYVSAVYQPKKSLWQLFHTSLPNPPLPFLIVEERAKLLKSGKDEESRVVMGLLNQLSDDKVAKYREQRPLDLGSDIGSVNLRYFVLNSTVSDLEYYVKSEQALTLTLNGQRQHAKSRTWLKNETGLHFLYKYLIVVVDCTGVTGSARRKLFPSTREMAADTEVTRVILERVLDEIREDTDLFDLDEQARNNALSQSTKSTTEKVKKKLATQISAVLKGELDGKKGGETKKKEKKRRRHRRKPRVPRTFDDSQFPDVPDKIEILNSPFEIEQGGKKGLRLGINGKNGFIPDKFDELKFIFPPELKPHISVGARGRLLGGVMRVSLAVSDDAPLQAFEFTVDMTSEELGISEKAKGQLVVIEAVPDDDDEDESTGGEPDIHMDWVERAGWAAVGFDEESVGTCNVTKNESGDITKVEFILNADFLPFEAAKRAKNLSGQAEQTFRERYGYAVAMGLFHQELANAAAVSSESIDEDDDSDEETAGRISPAYLNREKARWARAVLVGMEPDLAIIEESSDDEGPSSEAA